MATAEQKDFAKADEVREFTRGRIELVHIGGSDIGRWSSSRDGAGPSTSSRSPAPNCARHRTSSTTSAERCG